MRSSRRDIGPDSARPEAPGAAPLTIGELAGRSGVTVETIRYYEKEGVVPAASRSGPGRYREYRDEDVDRLRFIRRARDLGFSLDEVRELLAMAAGTPDRPCADVDRLARAHLAQVEAKLAQLAALREELSRVVGECQTAGPVGECRILAALSGSPKGIGSKLVPHSGVAPPPAR